MGIQILKIIQALVRIFLFSILVLCYLITAASLYPLYCRHPMKVRKYLCLIVSFSCRIGLKIIGLRISENYLENPLDLVHKNFLYVSNHLSYIDILVICSHHPACFVTSVEMRETFLLGLICKLAGCVFVERRNKKNIGNEIAEITEALRLGLSVVVFPEATSTKGESVLPFKRPLFRASFESKTPVLPLTINYTHFNGVPIDRSLRDSICWYGDMGFADHFFNFLKFTQTRATLTIGKVLFPASFSGREGALNDYVQEAYSRVSENFKPF